MTSQQAPTALNPFIVGGALSGRGFFGREDVFEFVRAALNATQRPPILLIGQRRIGKSSILRQLPGHLAADLFCVYFDLQGKATMQLDQVLYGLARAISESLGISLPHRNEATEETFSTIFLPRAIEKLRDPSRLVLLFDEFDVVDDTKIAATGAAGRLIPYLGEFIATYNQIGIIMVVGRKSEELSDALNSALLKDSVQKRIGRLERKDVIRLVHECSRGTITFTDAAATRVYDLAAGHPFCTQVLCHTVWKNHANWNQPIDSNAIDDAVMEAIELGTNGMNWIYDGLVTPEQRLLLSALSEAVDPLGCEVASIDEIQLFLRDSRLRVGSAELDRAARALKSWDVVVGDRNSGFRFQVPVLGAWVRRERPVAQLHREIRFANPRAWKFYELAVDSEQHGQLDAAIDDYRRALEANPVFLEVQSSLASALQKRNGPGDLDASREAWERALEIDPATPRTELLDVLMQGLERARSPDTVKARFARVMELDQDGLLRERAVRHVRDRALAKMAVGTASAINAAIEYYTLLGDTTGVENGREIRRKQRRFELLGVGLGYSSLATAILLAFFQSSRDFDLVVILLSVQAGTFFTWGEVAAKELKLTIWRAGLPFLFAGAVVGVLIWWYFESLLLASVAGFFISLLNIVTAPSSLDETQFATESLIVGEQRLVVRALDFAVAGILKLRARASGNSP